MPLIKTDKANVFMTCPINNLKPVLYDADEENVAIASKTERCNAFAHFDALVGATAAEIRGNGFGTMWYYLSHEQVHFQEVKSTKSIIVIRKTRSRSLLSRVHRLR